MRHYSSSQIAKRERFFALLRMTLDRVVILNGVKDLELRGVTTNKGARVLCGEPHGGGRSLRFFKLLDVTLNL
jgi:hypothetical protein